MLSGAGCTTKNPPTYDETFRIGYAKIIALPEGGSNDIITTWDEVHAGRAQGVALCSGDSGGPVYYVSNFRDISQRKIVAVNSRSSMQCVYGRLPDGSCVNDEAYILGTSFLSSLTTEDALKFLEDWSKTNEVSICGLDPLAQNCR